ncbi:hypothetical protein Droror1_Dr00009934 [Drosera rotundifolia]
MVSADISRLPVKSILRFRSVCKAWAAWSSDQHFAYKHLNANQNNDIEGGSASAIHCVIPSLGEGEGEQNQIVYNCSLQKLIDSEHSNSCSDGCHVTKASTRKVHVGSSSGNSMYCIGVCNGLMCCDYMGKFVIWNPTTKKTKSYSIASDSGDAPTYSMPTVDSSLGFGFDATTNTHKAILLWYKKPSLGGVGERMVFVCSFPTCRWRRIYQGITYKPNQTTGILFNGALHWLVIASFSSSYFIFAVDLTTEQGSISPVPVRVATGLFHPIELGVLRGCLALLGNDVVWTMKNYGVEDSWEKLFMFPRCEFCPDRSMPLPIWISEKGVAVLCINEFGMVSFDIKQQKFEKIPTHSTTRISKSWVSKSFAKSLLLPP